eukprot:GSChrysophyteH1.ASY1.ANO1.3138.1 assembled CDS
MFFEKDFSLYQAQVFDRDVDALSSGSMQVQKLSNYLDFVEGALLQQIWSRSGDIFTALDDIKGQQDQVSSAINKLETLHNHLRSVDERVTSSAVHIPLMHRRRKNQAALLKKLSCMQRIIEGRNAVHTLLEERDFLGALELLEECKKLYSNELTTVTSMKKIGEQLDAFDGFLCEVISNRFVSQAIEWEENDHGIAEEASELEKLAGNSEVSIKDDTNLTLGQLMNALRGVGRLTPAFNMYKSRLVEGLKLIVRTCVTEYMAGNDSITGSIDSAEDLDSTSSAAPVAGGSGERSFAKKIRAMPIDQFLSCVIICFENLLKALQRAYSVHQYMLSSLSDTEPPKDEDKGEDKVPKMESTTPDAGDAALAGDKTLRELSKTCLVSACDIAQRALSQLLLMRKADTARISLENIKLLWETSSHFVTNVEKISESSAYVIRQALQQQSTAFLSNTHEHAKIKLASTMDTEKWNQCDVPPEKQQLIDHLASGKTFLKGHDASKAFKGKQRRSRELTPVVVDGVPYKVVWSALLLMDIIMSYLEITMGFPSITGEVITSTKEIIQFFNKQTLTLVLGSGAQKSQAQLRSISAKHLTVTAQSLGLILAMLPHIRAAFLTQLPPNRSMQLTELDRLTQELLDHHSQILTKFVIILGDAIDMSSAKLSGVNWDTASGRTEYFEDVSKNITALHRVLLLDAMLPLEQVQDVFSRIFALLLRKLPTHFEDVMPHTKTGKQRILDEATHITATFSLLKNIECSGEMKQIEELFQRKYRV